MPESLDASASAAPTCHNKQVSSDPGNSEEYWLLLSMASRQFEEKGTWPHVDDLIYDLASQGISMDLGIPSRIPRSLGSINNEGELELGALGLIATGDAPRSSDALVQLVKLCVRLALEFRRSAKITSAKVAEAFEGDTFVCERALELIGKVPGLVGGGHGAKSDDEWDRDITVSALEYKDVETVEDLAIDLARRFKKMGSPEFLKLGPVGDILRGFAGLSEGAELLKSTDFDPRNVFVVYGRDSEATGAMWTFLEAIGLHPLSWDEMVRSTGIATPYTGDVVEKAFDQVQAVVVLLTPDDDARLHKSLRKEDDPIHEKSLTGQPRPNVFFEAGMAFGRYPDRTIIVELGVLRPASDLIGRNTVRIGSTEGPLQALANRLEDAGCPVNRAHPAWLSTERFTNLSAHSRTPEESLVEISSLPKGTRLTEPIARKETRITARLISNGKNEYLLEVVNRGNTNVNGLRWELPDSASNWAIMVQVLPQYPISEFRSGEHVRVPVAVMMSGPVITDLRIVALADGEHYETIARLSIYG